MGVARQCWVVTDGKIGMENQCRGLAEALGLPFALKRIVIRRPWRWLQPMLTLDGLESLSPKGDPLAPPWPDLVIASGRRSVAPALAVRRAAHRSGKALRLVQVQNPGVDPGRFDLVIAPRHDGLEGANVLSTTGALHRVDAARLAEAAKRFAPRYAALPRPLIAVLVGGTNRVFRFDAEVAGRLGGLLRQAAEAEGAGLAVTTSRRTPAAATAALRAALEGAAADIWDGEGDNPYFGLLALADAVVATGDSVNMVSEALATGRPVQVFELPGEGGKFARFHQGLREAGLTRPFAGRLERWTCTPPDDMARAVAAVERLFADKLFPPGHEPDPVPGTAAAATNTG